MFHVLLQLHDKKKCFYDVLLYNPPIEVLIMMGTHFRITEMYKTPHT